MTELALSIGLPNKLIEDGKVAVIYSNGYNNDYGWYTQHNIYNLIFDRKVAEMILKPFNPDVVLDYCQRTYGVNNEFRGIPNLGVVWIPLDTMFFFQGIHGKEFVVPLEEVTRLSIRA